MCKEVGFRASEEIKKYCKYKNITYSEFCNSIGIPSEYVWSWGRYGVSSEYLSILCKNSFDIIYILTGENGNSENIYYNDKYFLPENEKEIDIGYRATKEVKRICKIKGITIEKFLKCNNMSKASLYTWKYTYPSAKSLTALYKNGADIVYILTGRTKKINK